MADFEAKMVPKISGTRQEGSVSYAGCLRTGSYIFYSVICVYRFYIIADIVLIPKTGLVVPDRRGHEARFEDVQHLSCKVRASGCRV